MPPPSAGLPSEPPDPYREPGPPSEGPERGPAGDIRTMCEGTKFQIEGLVSGGETAYTGLVPC